MIMESGLNHPSVLPVGVGVVDVHGNSGDIDSLLSTDPSEHVPHATTTATAATTMQLTAVPSGPHNPALHHNSDEHKPRRVLEPYERHRAHDLRAECYRRGIRPIKKGPNANDNKNGYILLLRKYDGTANGLSPDDRASLVGGGGGHEDEENDAEGDSDSTQMNANKKRKLPPNPASHLPQQQPHGATSLATAAAVAAAAAAANDLAGFYDTTQASSLVSVLPMQYPGLVKAAAAAAAATPTAATATTTDLEILSGIANSYTTQTGGNSHSPNGGTEPGMFCGNCRTVVTDQLMESIRLGRNKMQLIERQRVADQRDRDTLHLKEVITVIRELRRALRDAEHENRLTHELLAEYEDDIAFFQALKQRTKERMRKEMQNDKPVNAGNVGTT